MNKLRYYVGVLIALGACQPKTAESEDKTSYETSDSLEINGQTNEASSPDTITVMGKVKVVDDMGYPMFYLQVEFEDEKKDMDFIMNRELAAISHENSWNLKGHRVLIDYTSVIEPNLLDIHSHSSSLLGEFAPEIDTSFKSITGILSGADEQTPGDLPGRVTITPKQGSPISFDFFVTQEMVHVDGQTVTVYYDMRPVNIIHKIGLLEICG